jgi:hypothetical protein
MTPEETRRKGSWAKRFHGRDKLSALVDSTGKPTRFALSAHAWGEPVPRSIAAARRIAAKGERLLARYRAIKARPDGNRNGESGARFVARPPRRVHRFDDSAPAEEGYERGAAPRRCRAFR